ncbi:TetR/AcrR family transcriptional regulator [Propionivibrio limicola]|uniref:TetR/AcrR family transcriptional regulator n=1 Tax=Propionivibrio limicola TaxID=167645 RepID=UPI001292751C|nr:TetR/AcrR family transcriptional regulator [Propionivibrio limicola]
MVPTDSSYSSTGERPARRRRKEARPAELTAAALEHFVEKGYAATRLEDVAAQAGVSKGTLYLYFENKEALFRAVVEEGIVPVLAAAEEMLADFSGSSVDLLRRLLFGWWEQVGATRLAGVPKLIVAEAHNFPEVAQYYHDNVIVRGRSLVRRVLARGIERGEFRSLDVETAIDVIIAPLLMLVIWQSSLRFCGPEFVPENYLQTHFELLVRGLAAGEETPGIGVPDSERQGV